jgi:hypothetical protein
MLQDIYVNTRKENKMPDIYKALDQVHEACEYYDMVHDTGDSKQTDKNKDQVWKGYETIRKFINKHKKGE